MKKFLVPLIVIILIVAGGVGYGVYRHHHNSSNSQQLSQAPATKSPTSTDPVSVVKADLTEKYSTLTTNSSSVGEIVGKVSGYDYAEFIDGKSSGHGVTFTQKSSTTTLPTTFAADVTASLTRIGYQAQTTPNADAAKYLSNGSNYSYYTHNGDNCLLAVSKAATLATFTCSTTNQFTSIALAAQPFVAGLAQAKGAALTDLAVGAPQIATNSQNKQYQHALVPYTSPNTTTPDAGPMQAGAYFYKQTSETTWTYYTSSQEGLGCTDTAKDGAASAAFSDICSKQGF